MFERIKKEMTTPEGKDPFDKMFNEMFNELGNSLLNTKVNNQNVIKESKEHIKWAFNAIAMEKDDIDIELNDKTISIKGKTSKGSLISNEINYSFILPTNVDEKTVESTLKGGILYLSADKKRYKQKSSGEKIEIQ